MTILNFFDISGDAISKLDDEDLRELVCKLCIADFGDAYLSTSVVRCGGHQNAPDGGLDVNINSKAEIPSTSYIPNKITGFQVKKTKMFPSSIEYEMRDDSGLKPGIKDLIINKGAYIIISSGSNTSDSEYKKRIEAMEAAIIDESGYENLSLDFYDQNRIAKWVMEHLSIAMWVRKKINRQLEGWQPYDNWSGRTCSKEGEYIIDKKMKLYDDADREHSVENGISLLRQKLAKSKSCIRLVGLSGVGKTRLTQALFDKNIGNDALNKDIVLYADMSDNPTPGPKLLASGFNALNKKVIIIIDNCGPELHRQLAKVCLETKSQLSLLTIEYDVKEDLPPETQVFRLEAASDQFIEELIRKRYDSISLINAKKIADFSEGNARIALMLASNCARNETLSNFKDEDLFKRIFWQRNQEDGDLLDAARVFSLLYSFNGEETGKNSELSILGSLINKSEDDIFKHIIELKNRGLLQSRSIWRAILPHAIANRLATQALEKIPPEKIKTTILKSEERIIKSFTHRLHYLHESSVAIDIVSEWLSSEGFIGKYMLNLNDLGMSILENIAPVCEDKTIEAIERAINDPKQGQRFTSEENPHALRFVKLLRHLAYNSERFDRSAMLMVKFTNPQSSQTINNQINELFISLFHIYFSATHATIEDRGSFIKKLLNSDEEKVQEIGMQALEAALKALHFSSHYHFEFGAKPRDFGFRPRSLEDVFNWYKAFIEICKEQAIGSNFTASKARKLFKSRLRELWNLGIKCGPNFFDIVEEAAILIYKEYDSSEIWVVVNNILEYDKKRMTKKAFDRTLKLRNSLRPTEYIDIARSYVLYASFNMLDSEKNFSHDKESSVSGHEKIIQEVEKIAEKLAKDEIALQALLPDFLSIDVKGKFFNFGVGLSKGCEDKKIFWNKLCWYLYELPEKKRNIDVLVGFLSHCARFDAKACNEILDKTLYDDYLGQHFPIFQFVSKIDDRAIGRLHISLEIDKAKPDTFSRIPYRLPQGEIEDNALVSLMEKIQEKEGGSIIVLEMLSARFYENSESLIHSEQLLKFGRTFLLNKISKDLVGKAESMNSDYNLSIIAEACIPEEGYENYIKELWSVIDSGKSIDLWEIKEFSSILAKKYPNAFLDKFLLNTESIDNEIHFFGFRYGSGCLNSIEDGDIIAWCQKDPIYRYPLILEYVEIVSEKNDEASDWRPIFYRIIEKTPDLENLLRKVYISKIIPDSWWGELSNILEQRRFLFDSLKQHKNVIVQEWAEGMLLALDERIKEEQKREKQENSSMHQRFE